MDDCGSVIGDDLCFLCDVYIQTPPTVYRHTHEELFGFELFVFPCGCYMCHRISSSRRNAIRFVYGMHFDGVRIPGARDQ
jgi:hypothetical protein